MSRRMVGGRLGLVAAVACSWACVGSAGVKAAESCPNEQLRAEQPYGLSLPDCRAYEMVSPVEKGDQDATTGGARASLSGEAITYESHGTFAESAGSRYRNRYISYRGSDGWSTRSVTPPYSSFQTNIEVPYENVAAFTPELSAGVLQNENPPLTSEALEGYSNLYVADFATGAYQLVTNGAPRGERGLFRTRWQIEGTSSDLSHVVFNDMEWVNGDLSEVDIAPGATTSMPGGASVGTPGDSYYRDRWHAVSADGSRVFFTSNEGEQLYVRENETSTVEVSASQRTTPDPHGPQPARYWGASADGSKVFFTSRAELTNDANTGSADSAANLYQYDLESGELTDLTVDNTDPNGAAVLGFVTAGEDGAYVYFVAEGDLAAGAEPGKANLYVSHDGETPQFIATLLTPETEAELEAKEAPCAALEEQPREECEKPLQTEFDNSKLDETDWSESEAGGPETHTAVASADGTHLAFLSTRSLTGFDNTDANTGEPDSEVFSYDADTGSLICVSCNSAGVRPVGSSSLGAVRSFTAGYIARSFSENGSRLFFDSRDDLVPQDSNGLQNVYEYENGHVYLISDGSGGFDSSFLDASPSGNDVFIATADQLLAQDQDQRVDVYDARVDGGFPTPVTSLPCDNGDSCKGPVSPQPNVFNAPASETFSGVGNLVPPAVEPKSTSPTKPQPKHCKKGFVKRHGKCVRKKRTKARPTKSSRHSSKGSK
jgi:WD40-like Beta Propeller Repeat